MSSETDENGLRLTVAVPDEETALELTETVDEVLDISVEDGSPVEHPRQSAIAVDIGTLTPKQWKALKLAYDGGYYDQPRSTDLETIAAELSISKSAVSQRLRAAEATIVEGVLEGIRARAES
ncbi:bacterio-opsin activator [Salinadaptatus halalkaliphilus]|uniref:Bacterio-opsin activator n=1 Tax=Salinadaptatus halalkaliphilus TaxID=2419781 RepID=A0A4S3TSZ7_9EURY|nr:helix-turn-helix domain-containing protein [Salinadaptatus halalkaliphilus]THE66543.1 bacterio-opsin activator [Salinadaptatus halalkaliphilus]